MVSEIFSLLKRRGVVETLKRVRVFLARKLFDESFDRKYGTDTSGVVDIDGLSVLGDKGRGIWYEPTSPRTFNSILLGLDVDFSQYVFFDIGSGKGRVLLLASMFPFKEIIGIEFARELHEIAQRNISIFRDAKMRCAAIRTVNADASSYQFPDDNLFLTFYSPFRDVDLWRKTIENAKAAAAKSGSRILLVFVGGNEGVIALLKENFYLQEVNVPRQSSFPIQYRAFVTSNKSIEDVLRK
jgi:hypothetical protein